MARTGRQTNESGRRSNVDPGNDGKTTVTPSLESIQKFSFLTNNFQADTHPRRRRGERCHEVGQHNWHGTAWDISE